MERKWEKQKIDKMDLQKYCTDFYYYKRKMGDKDGFSKTYCANIFMCFFENGKQLVDSWKDINYYIAFHFQSKEEKVIEKSNYYICLFTTDTIEIDQKNIIQDDSFCAKKYIFQVNKLDENICRAEIEKRIFKLTVDWRENTVPKIQSIELQNFRGYEGLLKLNLNGKKEKPAAFTLIYAKNGYGKTSLFDGIEYAFKGEVSRIAELQEINKKEPVKGAVYHNKNREDKIAYVKIKLDDGKIIYRKVSAVKQGKNDCAINSVGKNKGQDIVGNAKDRRIWDRIILPHDKIDSFISARTPAEQYKEWIKSAPELGQEEERFIDAHKKLGTQIARIENKKRELESSKSELEKLGKSIDSIKRVEELCKEYNAYRIDECKLDVNLKNANIDEYNRLCNEVKKRKRRIVDELLPLYQSYIQQGEKIKSGEIVDSYTLGEEKDKIIREKQKCNDVIRLKEEYVEAKQMIKKIQMHIENLQREKEPLEQVVNYGYGVVQQKKEDYLRLNDEISENQKTCEYFERELKKCSNDFKIISNEESTNKKKIELYNDGAKKIKDINNIKEMLKREKEEISFKQIKNTCLRNEIIGYDNALKKINEYELPVEISALDIINIGKFSLVLSDKDQEELQKLQVEFNEIKVELSVRKEELEKGKIEEKELKNIHKLSVEYLMNHRERRNCPLCKTSFTSWSELLYKVETPLENQKGGREKKIQQILKKQEEIEEKYKEFYVDFKSKKNKEIEKIGFQKLYNEIEFNKNKMVSYDLENRCKNLEEKIVGSESWFKNNGLYLNEFTIKEWEKLHDQLKNMQNEMQNKKDDIITRSKELMDLVEQCKKNIALRKEIVDKIVCDSRLYKNILFLLRKPNDFAWLDEKSRIEKDIEKLQFKLDKYKKIEKNNEKFAYIDIVAMQKSSTQLKEKLAKLEELEKEVQIFEEFSPQGIQTSLNLWNEKEKNCKIKIEILNQIVEENGAKIYFEKYKTIRGTISKLNSLIIEYEKQKDKLQVTFEIEKQKLENALKEHFSQNIMNEIFQKIDPHDIMKNIVYHLDFSENGEPQLFLNVCNDDSEELFYRPEVYFSTAQLNTVAFSSFFGRALTARDIKVKTICIDDPIGHFDDMNILGFTDMIRCILESLNCQIIMSTHDEKIFQIMKRKLDDDYYNTSFIRLADSEKIDWNKKLGTEIE